MNKIIIVDGNSLAFSRMPRGHELTSELFKLKSTGEDIYVARKFMKKILKYKYQIFPGYKLVVVFDEPNKSTFRHELMPGYKSKSISESRRKQKDYVYAQIEVIKRLLNEAGISVYSHKNGEADDIIGMLKTKLEAKGGLTTIVTGDKDLIQLVSNKTRIAYLDDKRNIKTYGRNNIHEISGEVGPDQIIGVKVLAGDKSDNIKGLGILRDRVIDTGTLEEATKYVKMFNSLNGLIANRENIPEPYRSSLIRGAKKVEMRIKLITIVTNGEIELDFNEFIRDGFKSEKFFAIIRDMNLEKVIDNNKGIKTNIKKEGSEG